MHSGAPHLPARMPIASGALFLVSVTSIGHALMVNIPGAAPPHVLLRQLVAHLRTGFSDGVFAPLPSLAFSGWAMWLSPRVARG